MSAPASRMCTAALEYAARDWHVFPAHSSGEKKSHKKAEFSNGHRWGATTDPDEVRHDFRKWPKANVGIATGLDSGIFVVEADTPEGHDVDGIGSFRKLEAEHCQLPETLMAESPSGSTHHYFKWPAGVTIYNSTSKIAPGVDVRGDGGMVIAPPSIKPGKGAYRWVNNLDIAEAPAWLIALATADDGDAERSRSAEPEADMGLLAAALAVIPNDDLGWEDWNRIGMAIWRATAAKGFALFDTWSQKSGKKYDARGTLRKWNEYFECPPTEIGAGSIFYEASLAAPGWREAFDDAIEKLIDTPNDAETQKAQAEWLRAMHQKSSRK